MIENVKYLVTCDDCDAYSAYRTKSEVREHWVIYRYNKVNPLADELFAKKLDHRPPKELHFCNPACAKRYFNYYPEQESHYRLVEYKFR